MTLDELFYKEFNKMMHELKAESGPVDLYSIPMPESLRHKLLVEKRDMVAISTI